jgi:type IV pilus assembly protein PilE
MLLNSEQHSNGITLLEVVIVISIIGIIAAFAYPSYVDAIRTGRRVDAVTSLLKLQLDQEKWRANHARYADKLGGDLCGSADATGLCWGENDILRKNYRLTITAVAADGSGFVATATPRPDTDQIHDACKLIVINQDGPDMKASSDPSCWNH